MSTPYTIRVMFLAISKEVFEDWIAQWGSYIAVEEDVGGDNHHSHAVIWSVKTTKQIRNSFTKRFPKSGPGAYSLKAVHEVEGMYRYICKGSSEGELPVVWLRHGIEYS